MPTGFSTEILRIIVLIIICMLVGLFNDQLLLSLIIGGLLYICWTLWQMRRLSTWLAQGRLDTPPSASGLWADVFNKFQQLQQRQLKEKEQRQALVKRIQEITTAMPDGVVVLNQYDDIEWFNQAAQELLALQKNSQGRSLLNLIHNQQFIDYYQGDEFHKPLVVESTHTPNVYLQYQIAAYGKGERLLIVRDITQLQQLEKMRQDFVADVSHELRTPLTVIHGYLETLADIENIPPTWLRALQQMQQQTQRMTLLVNDLISLSKLETEKISADLDSINIKNMLQSIQNSAFALSGEQQHRIALDCADDIILLGSHDELHSAFSNLVFNAVKYTPEQGHIEISAWKNEAGIHIAIKDNGVGIEAQHIPRLTERFYRVDDSRNSQTGGTGLGLAIVKHILLRHKATLEINSQPQQGSTFICHFSPLSVQA